VGIQLEISSTPSSMTSEYKPAGGKEAWAVMAKARPGWQDARRISLGHHAVASVFELLLLT